jgi:hypothetical protein
MITKKIISGIEFPADNVGCLIAITDVNWTQKTVENVWYPADTKFISRIDRPLNDRISHVDTIDTSNFRRGWWHIRQPISSFCKNSAYQVAMTRIRIRKIFKSLLWKKDVTVHSAETRTSRFGGKLLQVASIGWGGGGEEDARVRPSLSFTFWKIKQIIFQHFRVRVSTVDVKDVNAMSQSNKPKSANKKRRD